MRRVRIQRTAPIYEAHQWFKNGDHPEDDVFRPFDTGEVPTEPQKEYVDRLGGFRVCPGSWILTTTNGKRCCKSDQRVRAYYDILDEGVVMSDRVHAELQLICNSIRDYLDGTWDGSREGWEANLAAFKRIGIVPDTTDPGDGE